MELGLMVQKARQPPVVFPICSVHDLAIHYQRVANIYAHFVMEYYMAWSAARVIIPMD
jgi:hypothetical protein